MKKSFIAFLIVILISLSGCGSGSSQKGLNNFSADTLNGKAVDESIFKDYDLTMVNIWATFCGPCINEMPDLGELAKEYENEGVQIVGIVSDVSSANDKQQISLAKDIVAETDADYIHIIPSSDLEDFLSDVTAVPTTYFVDKDGNIIGEAYVGSKSKSQWEKIIKQNLKEVGP